MQSSVALSVLIAITSLACAPAHLIGSRPPRDPVEAGPPRTVVVDSLVDRAEWKSPGEAALSPAPKAPADRPLFTRPQTLAAIHERLVPAIAALRPHWTVVAPSAAAHQVKREAVVVRTVIDGNQITQTDRPLKNAAFAFGLVLLPLQIITAFPVEETQRISGMLERISVDPPTLKERLVKYATQPDFTVNFAGVPARQQPFALDVEYEEGLFADETPRPAVLVEGFVEKLAYAIVAFVEEEGEP